MEDGLIFGLLTGVVLAVIFFSWKKFNTKSEPTKTTKTGGGGGYTGVSDGVAGELPKDNIK